jgi:chorismate--pyruvate lyase
LVERGSLTAALVAACREFSVQPVSEGLALPLADEAELLGIPRHQRVRVREVCLLCDGVARVYARSVLPLTPRDDFDRLFCGLGRRSLGKVLFADPAIARGRLSFAPLGRGDWRVRRIAQLHQRGLLAMAAATAPLWARRSAFGRGARRLLVTEVFLPAVLALGAAA